MGTSIEIKMQTGAETTGVSRQYLYIIVSLDL